jgi:hypothetical protein
MWVIVAETEKEKYNFHLVYFHGGSITLPAIMPSD